MPPPNLKRVREGYEADIADVRSRLPDDQIMEILERYRFGGLDRDQSMEALGIDYLGTLYELVALYEIQEPEPDPVEEERQENMLRLLLDGEEVPIELRQPASWRVRH